MVHWKLAQDTKVSYELLLSVEATHEVRKGQKIVKVSMRTVDKYDIDANVEPFQENTDKTVTLKVPKGEVVLAPEKVKSG